MEESEMIYLLVVILVLLLIATSTHKIIRFLAVSGITAVIMSVVTAIGFMIGCDAKLFSNMVCEGLGGLVHAFHFGILAGIMAFVISFLTLHVTDRNKK